jgi:hypothetical protein
VSLPKDIREAAERVSSYSRSVLEEVAVTLINRFLGTLLEIFALEAASKWDEVAVKLLDRGFADPSRASTDDILAVLEEIHDKVDFDDSLKNADPLTKNIAVGIIGTACTLAHRFASRELIDKFTYEKVLEQARKRGLSNIEKYLTTYPNLSRKLIDWLRRKLVDGFKT